MRKLIILVLAGSAAHLTLEEKAFKDFANRKETAEKAKDLEILAVTERNLMSSIKEQLNLGKIVIFASFPNETLRTATNTAQILKKTETPFYLLEVGDSEIGKTFEKQGVKVQRITSDKKEILARLFVECSKLALNLPISEEV